MTVDIRPFPRPDWSPLPFDGCVGVVGEVIVREDDFFVAMLRFDPWRVSRLGGRKGCSTASGRSTRP